MVRPVGNRFVLPMPNWLVSPMRPVVMLVGFVVLANPAVAPACTPKNVLTCCANAGWLSCVRSCARSMLGACWSRALST